MPDRKNKTANRKPATPTDWSNVADWYDNLVGEEGSELHREVIFPNTLRLLALQPNDPVLDVACGQGAFCRLLHGRGAKVTGVDAATPLIKLARERGDVSIKYFVADARRLDFLPPAHFAAASCILAIQNIDDVTPVFTGVARTLAPGGGFVCVMMHPAFRGPKFTSWGWDDEKKVQYRRVDRYLLPRKEPIFTHPGKKTGQYTWTFHRPLQSYVKALRTANLLIDALDEWPSHKQSTSGHRAPAENTARKEIPMFLAIRAVKVSAASPTAAPSSP